MKARDLHDDLAKFIQALKTFSRINCTTCSNRNIFVEFGKIKISKFRREGFSLVTYSYLRNFILSIIKTFFSSRDRSWNTHVTQHRGRNTWGRFSSSRSRSLFKRNPLSKVTSWRHLVHRSDTNPLRVERRE